VLKQVGIDADKEIKILQLGGGSEVAAALKPGESLSPR
jgi:hypothetical protein